ncbi:MAG: SOS response-associated peptidase [Pseudomonadota bacterium]
MCGRYLLTAPPDEVAQTFSVDVRDNFPPRYNIAPTQPVAAVRLDRGGARAYALLRWGFIPGWRGTEAGRPLINARAETVAEKRSFSGAFKRRRCLVPASGFYEWRRGEGAPQPFLFEPAAGGLFAFAGIWETSLADNGSEAETVAMLTIEAGPDMAAIHHREPVVVAPDAFDRWLTTDETETAALAPLLRAQAAGFWRSRAVSKAVNKVANDGPALIEPAAPPAQGALF